MVPFNFVILAQNYFPFVHYSMIHRHFTCNIIIIAILPSVQNTYYNIYIYVYIDAFRDASFLSSRIPRLAALA